MNKVISFIVSVIILVLAGCWVYQSKNYVKNNNISGIFEPQNATYIIEGDSITLVNGKAEKEITSGSASKIEVMTWGQVVTGDLNADKSDDAVLMLTYSTGGSGTFYYIVAALKDSQSDKAIGTNAILLGDRIAPQNFSIDKGIIVVNYADRKSDEPMSTPPSEGITRNFKIQDTNLVEIIFCRQEQRDADGCNDIYSPICAKVNIQCIKAPCDPIYQTFGNNCQACMNPLVEYYTAGECK
jgi:hypothetical protein